MKSSKKVPLGKNEEAIIESIAEWLGKSADHVRPEMLLDDLNLDYGDKCRLAEWLMNDESRVPDCRWGCENWEKVSDIIASCMPAG